MDVQDSTAPSGLPEYDPAASGGPPYRSIVPAPIPGSVDVPELVRERHDEAALDDSYDRGARDALLKVLRVLDLDLGPELLGTLRVLTYRPLDYVPAVLRSLDGLQARLHTEGGE